MNNMNKMIDVRLTVEIIFDGRETKIQSLMERTN